MQCIVSIFELFFISIVKPWILWVQTLIYSVSQHETIFDVNMVLALLRHLYAMECQNVQTFQMKVMNCAVKIGKSRKTFKI